MDFTEEEHGEVESRRVVVGQVSWGATSPGPLNQCWASFIMKGAQLIHTHSLKKHTDD